MKQIFIAALFLFLFLESEGLADQLQIASSIYPVTDIIRQIGGDHVRVITIIDPGSNPHTFEPKPSLVRDIAISRIWFMIGAGLEFWAAKFISASDSRIKTIILSEGIPLIRDVSHHDPHKDSTVHSHLKQEDSHTPDTSDAANPHIWLDPELVKIMAEKIKTALIETDPEHSEDYRQRTLIFLTSLDQLSQDIRKAVSEFSNKKYVTFHPAWDYFSKQYGLECVGVIESVPGMNPTPKHIHKIVTQLHKFRISALFAEPQFNPKIAEVIAKEAGVRVLLLDPLGGPDIQGRDTYMNLMRYNLTVLQEGLR